MVMVAHVSDISILGMSQPRAPSKVLDIVKCFCKSTTLYITKRCRLRKHGCPCMVHFRAHVHRFVLITLKSHAIGGVCYQDHGHMETILAQKVNPFIALTGIRSQFLRTQ